MTSATMPSDQARRSSRDWATAVVLRIVGGILLFSLLYQIPARHQVEVGYNDAAYVQGFGDPVNRWGVVIPESAAETPLRWSTARSFVVFPQIGLPAEATLRWRALRPAGSPPPRVTVLLNGRELLGSFTATGDWETHRFPIDGGLLKPNDVFLELRTEPMLSEDDLIRGVQVDRAELATTGWPIIPYPAQILYGTLALAAGTLLVRTRGQQMAVVFGLALVFLVFYRLQITPHPLRSLPPLLAAVLLGLGALRTLPRVAPSLRHRVWAASIVGGVVAWFGWLLLAGQAHTALSVPGVERDFPIFATRASALWCSAAGSLHTSPCVLRADGFYNLGYPLLLWLAKPLAAENAFVAAKYVAAASGVLLLLATAALAWRLAPFGERRTMVLLALLCLGFSPFVVQYALYVGTDMPFAALWAAALAALVVPRRESHWSRLIAGVLCGLAFLVRHPGLLLLPLGWTVLLCLSGAAWSPRRMMRDARRALVWFTCGWLLGAAPQLVVNTLDAGVPLYSQQAKNIWLAVYGNIDFAGRWADAANDVSLHDIILADPTRFAANWFRNVRAFVGTGAEDTSEFGQAIMLRLLGFPANWLAIAGLAGWLWRGNRRARLVLAGAALYVISVSVGFVLLRFFLPLAPIWAVAAAASTVALGRWLACHATRLSPLQWRMLVGGLLALALAGGPRLAARYVLERQDPSLPMTSLGHAHTAHFTISVDT